MKRTLILSALVLLAGVLLTGCCQKCRKSREAATRPIQNVVWHLTQFDGQAVDHPNRYELTFGADGTVTGVGECNRFFGPYEVKDAGGSIKIGPVASTMMACPDMDFETEFFRMLDAVHLYQLDESHLYLFVNNKIMAVFEQLDKPVETPAPAARR